MQTPFGPKQFTSYEFIELDSIKSIRCVIQDKGTEKYKYIKTYY